MLQKTLNGNSFEILEHKHKYAIMFDKDGIFRSICVCCGFFNLSKKDYYKKRNNQATLKQIRKSVYYGKISKRT